MSAACTYCGGTEWDVQGDRTVVCRQCGLSPEQALTEDRKHRQAAPLHRTEPNPVELADARTAELRRRADKVVLATDGLPVRDRLSATTDLLVVAMRLPAAMWDERFTAWKREMQAAARGVAS